MQSLPERDFRHWRELAGERAQEMLADRAAAMEGMGDPEAGVRMAAMGILSRHWNSKRDMDFAEACERLAVEDADPRVRFAAILCLGDSYEGQDHVRISALLARVVRDESETERIRAGAAYVALLRVRRPAALIDLKPPMPALKDVDWDLVDGSLNTARPPRPAGPHWPLTTFLSEDRAKGYALYRDAIESFERSDFIRSVGQFSEALRLDPNSTLDLFGRARALAELGRAGDAIEDLTRVLELAPRATKALRERARLYRANGAKELAEADDRAATEVERHRRTESGAKGPEG